MSKVWKNLILVFLASFMGIMSNPEMLTASDSVRVEAVSDAGVVETVAEEESTPEVATPTASYTAVKTVAAKPATPVASTPDNYISVNGRIIEVISVDNTGVDAGNHVNKIGKMLYGHNSSAVFGSLTNLAKGDTFTVVYGGVSTTYRVSDMDEYKKNQNNGRLQKNGSGNYMSSIKNTALGHDLALMTCSGSAIEGKPGDATHRYVVFADEI